jgi:hypothetical protein
MYEEPMNNSTQPTRDPIAASKDLRYEIDMLEESFGGLSASPPTGFYRNMLIECFAIHARILYAFLYEPRAQDDVIAQDYTNGDWSKLRETEPPAFDSLKRLANKQVAHLTYARVLASSTWDFAAIVLEFRRVLKKFLDNALDSRLGPEMLILKQRVLQSFREQTVSETQNQSVLRCATGTTTPLPEKPLTAQW